MQMSVSADEGMHVRARDYSCVRVCVRVMRTCTMMHVCVHVCAVDVLSHVSVHVCEGRLCGAYLLFEPSTMT